MQSTCHGPVCQVPGAQSQAFCGKGTVYLPHWDVVKCEKCLTNRKSSAPVNYFKHSQQLLDRFTGTPW